MVGKCANPECVVPFRYFRDGKLFRFDLGAPSPRVRIQPDCRRIEHFWLCGACASMMTLIWENGVGVTTRSLPHSIPPVKVSSERSRTFYAGA